MGVKCTDDTSGCISHVKLMGGSPGTWEWCESVSALMTQPLPRVRPGAFEGGSQSATLLSHDTE